MLDRRVYRAAFVPALLAIVIVAFSLGDRPTPAVSPVSGEAFDGARAFGSGPTASPNSLRELAEAFPDRRPGSAGDGLLADRVERDLRDNEFRDVRRDSFTAQTADGRRDLVTVVGVRPGVSPRRIVVLAHRDARSSPGRAELSGTAALLEIARVFRGRELRKTLVLVSTSGGSGGAAGARAVARQSARGPTDAVVVLGDLASDRGRKPWVVPWSNAGRPAPLALRRTVESAVRAEVGAEPGGYRASAQWARRAVPLTVGEQGELNAAKLPAILLQVSGERGPRATAEVSEERLDEFGRAALRAITAIDDEASPRAAAAETATTAATFQSENGIVTSRKLLPDWAVRLLVGTLLLPALLAAVDAFFRVRRRRLPTRRWLAWIAAGTLPLLLAYAWLRILGLFSVIPAPPALVPAGGVAVDAAGALAVVSTAIVLALGWFGARRAVVRAVAVTGNPAAGGGSAALGVTLGGVTAAVWFTNPYAAAVLLPAAHLWLLASTPETRLRGWAAAAAVAGGLVLPALVLLYYLTAFSMSPLEGLWAAVMLTAGGGVGLLAAVALSFVLSCLGALLTILRARRGLRVHEEPPKIATRGPLSYAGPGSLGGTKSALRR